MVLTRSALARSGSLASSPKAAVIGGGGFVGQALALALHKAGYDVVSMDVVRRPNLDLPESVTFYEGDICNINDLRHVCRGCSCVFQVASYGMSGKQMLDRKRIEKVNLGGTQNVISVCIEESVPCLIYTSSYNTVFVGQVIDYGTEDYPYPSENKFVDHYSRTKSLAERMVIASNGAHLTGGGSLKTCAIRPAAIYGPGEERHTPRILDMYRQGLVSVAFGLDTKQDWVHVDNLVQGHLLAARSLQSVQSIAAGQVYCIADGEPVNTIRFFKPLVEGLGYSFPQFSIPVMVVYYFAYLVECVHWLISRIINFNPVLTRAEVCKTAVTHYFSINKAQAHLGYTPRRYSMDEIIDFYRQKGWGKPIQGFSPARFSLLYLLLTLCALILAILCEQCLK